MCPLYNKIFIVKIHKVASYRKPLQHLLQVQLLAAIHGLPEEIQFGHKDHQEAVLVELLLKH